MPGTYAPLDSGTGEFTDSQLEDAERLMQEVPRIEAALKNFLSLRMAEDLTGSGEGTAKTRPSPAVLQGCARVFLRALNTAELPPAFEWSQLHPQADKEGGMDFMVRLGDYKVVHALWVRCRNAGGKPAKFLGRSALKHAYPEIAKGLLADLSAAAAAAGATEDHMRSFVDSFGLTIAQGEQASPDCDVVWAADVRDALAARQKVRKTEAAERAQRALKADGFAEEMRAALTGQEDSIVKIEEVTD